MKVVRKSLATQIKPQSGRKERSGLQKLAKVEKGKYNEVDAYVHCSEFLFYYFFVSFFFLFIFFIFFLCIFVVAALRRFSLCVCECGKFVPTEWISARYLCLLL